MKKLNLFLIAVVALFAVTSTVKAETIDCQGDVGAKISDQCYASVKDAFAEATDDDTIVVMKDIDLSSDSTGYLILGKSGLNSYTFDLNGHEITGTSSTNASVYIAYGETATIIDSSDEKTGIIKHTDNNGPALKIQKGTVTLNGGTYTNSFETNATGVIEIGGSASDTQSNSRLTLTINDGVVVDGFGGITLAYTGSHLIVNGGYIESDTFAISGNGNGTHESIIEIKGGTLVSRENAVIYHPQTGNLTITGGNITGKIGIVARQGDVVINGGDINATGTTDETIRVGDSQEEGSYVQLPTGVAIVVDNTNDTGYEDDANVTITNGNINGDVDSLLSYGETTSEEDEFIVSGGKFNHTISTEYLSDDDNYGQSVNGVVGKLHEISYSDPNNGTVSLPENAVEGETVTIDYTPAEGFVIDTIVVVTKTDGTKVEVVGDQFVMPEDDVIVTVTFKEAPAEVPSTGDNVLTYAIMGTVALISVLGTAVYFKKVNE